MAGHSILYLGRDEFAEAYLSELETLSCCSRLARHAGPGLPESADRPDIVLIEAPPTGAANGSAHSRMAELRGYPVVALTDRRHEHRGINALRSGAEAYIVIDDVTVDSEEDIFEHALERFRLRRRLSDTDVTVLSVLYNINDGVIVVDVEGRILDINPAARRMLGLGPRMLPDASWEETFCCVDDNGAAYRNGAELPLVRARSGEQFSNQVATYRAPEQPDILLSINGQGLYDGSGELAGGVITFRDVTTSRQHTTELERRRRFDELTGLPNRTAFVEHLIRATGRSNRSAQPLAVLFIDIDRFKSVNDTLGHDRGDQVLRAIARRLRDNLRVGDFSARWGEDRFAVCLEDFGEGGNAAHAAQKILLVLSEKYDVAGSEVFATPSIGIATCPDSAADAERLIKAADIALKEAKKRGGGRFQFYTPAMNVRLEQREELEVGLRHALVRGEFVLHYQPRIDLGSGRLIGLEALLRWQHSRFGLLSPARFLPILESSGLIHSAGEWVIETACRQLAGWQRQFEMPDLSVTINVSPQQLAHRRIVDRVRKALADSALDPGCVELEIAGGEVIRKRSAEVETLAALRKLGVRLSLDHFGTGEVSFESLDSGFIDSFVLDPSLISDIVDNDSHQRIVRAAIAMAQGLDIEVAAEGVENLNQLEFLRSCNCDLAQGFLISRPIQSDKVAALLRGEIAGTRLLARPAS